MLKLGPFDWGEWGAVMKPLLLWVAVPLLLLSACMLIVGIGSPALWIAGATVGVALVVVGRGKRRAASRR
jgi:hypothetical protein